MERDEINVRLAGERDAAELSVMGARMFAQTYGPYNLQSDIDEYLRANFTLDRLADDLADPWNRYLLAEFRKAAVGYAMLRKNEPANHVVMGRPIELARIYVESDLIGKGIGSLLMDSCLEQASKMGYATMWLGVWTQNETAIAFYRRWGFEVVGEHEFILGQDVQNDFLMARRILIAE